MDILTDLQGLARALRRDLGLQAGYSEHLHPVRDGETVTDVSIYVEIDGRPTLFQGSTHPMDGALYLPALRDELCRFITERKKEAA